MLNPQAMQVVGTKAKDGKITRHRPADTNIRSMAMGSWHARLSKGGELSARKRAQLRGASVAGPVAKGSKP